MSGLPEAYDEPEAPSVEPRVEDELPIRDHEQPPASPVYQIAEVLKFFCVDGMDESSIFV